MDSVHTIYPLVKCCEIFLRMVTATFFPCLLVRFHFRLKILAFIRVVSKLEQIEGNNVRE